MNTSTKKTKVIGTEQFINTSTGEIEEMNVTLIEDRDFNFKKIWLKNFCLTIDLLGSKKMKVVMWILDNIDKENCLKVSMPEIASATGISLRTVKDTMKILKESNFLTKVGLCYMVNPDIIYRGSYSQRMNMLQQYSSEPRKVLSDDEQLANIDKAIMKLQKQKASIQIRKNNAV